MASSTSIPTRPLRIAFIHPNLGIGGAERLVVNAAVGLQDRGHWVEIFTSHHEDGEKGRSFEETRNGTLKVHVLGSTIFPPSLHGRFTIVFAILRQLHLTFSFILASLMYYVPLLPLPLHQPFASSSDWSFRRQLPPFDIVIVDQLSASIPLLRWIGSNRVVFYCHFPDLLLSPSRSAHEHLHSSRPSTGIASIKSMLRSIYRAPIDLLEEVTTGQADKILVNSEFTSQVFRITFKGMGRIPRVVYPGIDVGGYGSRVDPSSVEQNDLWLLSENPTLLSINRFEQKKDIELAVQAFAQAKLDHPSLKLIVAGGYDSRLPDNVNTLVRLQTLATSLSLSFSTFSPSPLPRISSPPIKTPSDIIFLLNMSSSQKSILLSSPSVIALLYTPSYEHLGIVPIEGMASGLPVLATNTGGPTETIVDAGLDNASTTGLLRIPSADVWAQALRELLLLSVERRREIGEAGKRRAREKFSIGNLAKDLELACVDAGRITEPIHAEVAFLKTVGFICMAWMIFASALLAVLL